MIRQSVAGGILPITFTGWDKKLCIIMASVAMIQCVTEIIFAGSVIGCAWTVERAMFEYDTLARIMYLYDWQACGIDKKNRPSTAVRELILKVPDDVKELHVMPIRHTPVHVTVSTRLSAAFRKHMSLTIWIHIIWLLINIAVLTYVVLQPPIIKRIQIMKFFFIVFQFSFITICVYDFSMAAMYVTHIKQSLTKGMILRYSGWFGLSLKNDNEFGGYLPLIATLFWLRGLIFFGINCYCSSIIGRLIKRMQRRDVSKMMFFGGYKAVPEPARDVDHNDDILYYRAGESVPQADDYLDRFFRKISININL